MINQRSMTVGLVFATMVWAMASDVSAQQEITVLSAELERLADGEASEIAPLELEMARELLRLATEAQASGSEEIALTLLSLVPLQLRLVREIVSAANAEQQADMAETRLLEVERERRIERLSLDHVLERLLGLTAARRRVE